MLPNIRKPKTTMIFFGFLILGLGISMACRLQSSPATPQVIDKVLPATREVLPAGPGIPATSELVEPTDQPTDVPLLLEWDYNWLHFGMDSQFSSYNPYETKITKENISGLRRIGGAGCDDEMFSVYGGTPALYKGKIIVTHAGGKLEASNAYSGEKAWDFGENAYGWAPPPVVSTDGIIYYLYVTADASSKLYTVQAETGQKIWEAAAQFKTGFNFDTQATVDEKNDLVYILEDMFGDGRLYAVDRNTGEIQWFLGNRREKEGITFVGHIIPLQDDKLYVPAAVPETYSKQERMVRVDALSQEVDLQYDIPEGVTISSNVAWYGLCNNRLFESYRAMNYSDPANILAAHSIDQPGVTWQIDVPGQSGHLACDAEKDTIYVPTDQGLLALEASTGKTIWEHKSIKSVFSPTIANGIIYYISDTNMYALDEEDGSPLFRFPLGAEGDSSTGVAVIEGLVVFSGNGGTCDLYVLGLK